MCIKVSPKWNEEKRFLYISLVSFVSASVGEFKIDIKTCARDNETEPNKQINERSNEEKGQISFTRTLHAHAQTKRIQILI